MSRLQIKDKFISSYEKELQAWDLFYQEFCTFVRKKTGAEVGQDINVNFGSLHSWWQQKRKQLKVGKNKLIELAYVLFVKHILPPIESPLYAESEESEYDDDRRDNGDDDDW